MAKANPTSGSSGRRAPSENGIWQAPAPATTEEAMTVSIKRLVGLSMLAMLVGQSPAFAHHVMGGKLPETFMQGLLSGLAHPVIGLDHFGAIVGVGILAALAGRSVGLVLVFSVTLIAGVGIHLAKVDIPVSELLVALSTLAIGAVVLLRRSIGLVAAAALFAIAGLLHGYALGESIVGAEASPLIAYLAGLLVIQTLIGVAAYALTKRVGALRPAGLTVAGLLVVLMGGVSTALAAGALI
jgi:urease accessory protein